MTYLSELKVLSPFIFPTRPRNGVEQRANTLVKDRLKRDGMVRPRNDQPSESFIDRSIAGFVRRFQDTEYAEFLANVDWLVPVPGSSLRKPSSLWVPLRIAQQLRHNGIGEEVREYLRRTTPVPRSSQSSSAGGRTTVPRHVETLGVPSEQLVPPRRILLVDDVVTMGTTLIASASRLAASFATAPDIVAFAFARVQRFGPQMEHITDMLAPAIQTITYTDDAEHASRD